MSTKEAKQMDQALFDFYGKPSIGQALPLAIQHVLATVSYTHLTLPTILRV